MSDCPGIDNNLKCLLIDLLTDNPLNIPEIEIQLPHQYPKDIRYMVWDLVDKGRLIYTEDRKFVVKE